jgi:hypothetical protein
MVRRLRLLIAFISIAGLGMPGASIFAAPKEKPDHADKPGKAEKQMHGKKQEHKSGKDMLGDKIKKNGKHQLEKHGKNTASAEVKDGKITGVDVENTDTGKVPVTKYKSTQKMASNSRNRYQLASLGLAPAQQYVDTVWIGYAYIDEYGDEIIYWFPYDMVYDPYTGAIDYYPA